MAHPSRAQHFDHLREKLQVSDAQFCIDQNNCLLENSKASWRMFDPEADFQRYMTK